MIPSPENGNAASGAIRAAEVMKLKSRLSHNDTLS